MYTKEFGINIGDDDMRKKMSHKLTDEQKKEIVSLINDGFSPSDVAKKFEVSRTTVYNIVKKSKEGAK